MAEKKCDDRCVCDSAQSELCDYVVQSPHNSIPGECAKNQKRLKKCQYLYICKLLNVQPRGNQKLPLPEFSNANSTKTSKEIVSNRTMARSNAAANELWTILCRRPKQSKRDALILRAEWRYKRARLRNSKVSSYNSRSSPTVRESLFLDPYYCVSKITVRIFWRRRTSLCRTRVRRAALRTASWRRISPKIQRYRCRLHEQ